MRRSPLYKLALWISSLRSASANECSTCTQYYHNGYQGLAGKTCEGWNGNDCRSGEGVGILYCYNDEKNCFVAVTPAGGQGDPHLTGGHGDKTDMRGFHNVTLNMLTFPNISMGLTTTNALFMLPRLEVDGSFITKAYFVIRSPMNGATILVFSNAQKLSFTVSVDDSPQLTFGPHRSVVLEDIKVQTKEVKLVVTTGDWEVTLIRRKVRVPLDEVQFRFDVAMKPLRAEKDFVVWPHGILGQTFDGDSIAVDGKMDVYQNAGPKFTTSAMAEGFIEGTLTDYVLADPFSPDFKYSRYDLRKSTPPRNVSKLTGTFRSVQNTNAGAETIEVEDA